MKSIIYLIIIGAAVYLGYGVYMQKYGGGSSDSDTPPAPTAEVQTTPAGSTPPTSGQVATAQKPAQTFKSKIMIPSGAPGEKHLAKPGTFYVLERSSIEHDTGVAAVVPGEEVRVIARKGNGVVKVTNGRFEFEFKESQLTNDLDVAQEAERKFVLTHPPARQ